MGTTVEQPWRLSFPHARRIAKALGFSAVDRPSEVLRGISNSIAVYRHVAEFDQQSPPPAEIRDRIAKLGENAQALVAELEALRPYMEGMGSATLRRPSPLAVSKLRQELSELAAVSLSARQVRILPGRPKDRALRFLIVELADFYFRETGNIHWRDDTASYEGEFFGLVKACLDAAGFTYQSDQALGQATKRALKGWRPDGVQSAGRHRQ
jgi:hypothetical protein